MEIKTKSGNSYIYNPDKRTFRFDAKNTNLEFENTSIKYDAFEDVSKSRKGRINPDQITLQLANLNHLNFEVTDKCNLSCKYCSYGSMYNNYDKRQDKRMQFSIAKRIVDYIFGLKRSNLNTSFKNDMIISFYGGEPLLNFPLIKKIIKYIEKNSPQNILFRYNMTTNGVLLKKHIDFLSEKNFRLLISLDGNEYNNSYRCFPDGSSSYSIVYENIKTLQKRYPEYFLQSVKFNSVLHDRNNEQQVTSFFESEFNKKPMISPISNVGIIEERQKEYIQMYKKRSGGIDPTLLDDISDSEVFFENPTLKKLSFFLKQYSTNFFPEYIDLFKKEGGQNPKHYLPTGTCFPFSRKLFLTVNGKILQCERIGHEIPLGTVTTKKIYLDLNRIAKSYNDIYDSLESQCSRCHDERMCLACIFTMETKNDNRTCQYFMPLESLNQMLSDQLSLLEKNPKFYTKILSEFYYR
jgi:uncharacterized protein